MLRLRLAPCPYNLQKLVAWAARGVCLPSGQCIVSPPSQGFFLTLCAIEQMPQVIVITAPSAQTLRKYGWGFGPYALSDSPVDDWLALLDEQGGMCPICEKVPTTGRFVTDHEHVRGWKAMPPEKRRAYVRMLSCWTCNTQYLGRGITLRKAENMVRALRAYEARRPK